MLIVIDLGNTSIKFGLFDGMELIDTINLPSGGFMHTVDSLGLQLSTALLRLGKNPDKVTGFVLSSVVPYFDAVMCDMTVKYFGKKALIVGKDLIVPLQNKYDSPHEVGADRLVAGYAASFLLREYSKQAKSFISIDFGTATTFDCIDDDKYLGGLICPGVLSSHASLSQKAAKLPRIALETDALFPEIGKSTAISISHGFVFGFVAMTQGLLEKLCLQLSYKPFIIATGGFAPSIAKHIKSINVVEPNLILFGLAALYYNNTNK